MFATPLSHVQGPALPAHGKPLPLSTAPGAMPGAAIRTASHNFASNAAQRRRGIGLAPSAGMRTSLDSYLGVHPQALSLEARRNELLAANLANVDTPNYKARDIDFKAAMAAAGGNAAATPGATLSLTPANTPA